MVDSLSRIAALPGSTRICCAHEYTLSNLKFALQVEPDNEALRRFAERCQSLRAQGLPTLPSTLTEELAINPFLRCTQPGVVASARSHDPSAHDEISVFAALRGWKNTYR